MKNAIVIGSKGQDGQILCSILRAEGTAVVEISRSSELRLEANEQIISCLKSLQPDEIYYLAAVHHASEDKQLHKLDEILELSKRIHVDYLEMILSGMERVSPKSRLFYASSSHVFGNPAHHPQHEKTPLRPETPYAVTKAEGMAVCDFFRSRGLFASTGILYNHDSILRPDRFFSKKVTKFIKSLKHRPEQHLVLGTLETKIDWGYAPDFVNAMSKIIRFSIPDSWVVSTGCFHTLREFVEIAFRSRKYNWETFVSLRPELLARNNYEYLGDPSKLKTLTGWSPTVSFEEMVLRMFEDPLLQPTEAHPLSNPNPQPSDIFFGQTQSD